MFAGANRPAQLDLLPSDCHRGQMRMQSGCGHKVSLLVAGFMKSDAGPADSIGGVVGGVQSWSDRPEGQPPAHLVVQGKPLGMPGLARIVPIPRGLAASRRFEDVTRGAWL
jgi:hypothetical protein